MLFLLFLTLAAAQDLAEQEVISANNKFCPKIYDKIFRTSGKNFVVCPFAIQLALAFAQSGAKGETAEEMRTALLLPNSKETIETGFKKVLKDFSGGDGFCVFHIANRMFLKKKPFLMRKEFQRKAKSVYNGGYEIVDFLKRRKTAKKMNKFVERNTKNRVGGLVTQKSLDKNTRVILLNVVYFMGEFQSTFPKFLTQKSLFYKSDFDFVNVDMMYQNDGHLYDYCENFELDASFLELPFRGEDASLVIGLPNLKNGLSTLENQFEKVLTPCEFKAEAVNIVLPKFNISTRMHLKNLLQLMGVKLAFTKRADFSGIGGKKGDYHLSEFLGKSYMSVSENGIEVAATSESETGVGYAAPAAAPAVVSPVKNFVVDHPFVFYVKIKKMIVFIGRVLNPLQ